MLKTAKKKQLNWSISCRVLEPRSSECKSCVLKFISKCVMISKYKKALEKVPYFTDIWSSYSVCSVGSWPRRFCYTDVPRQNHERRILLGPCCDNYGQWNGKVWEGNIYIIEKRNNLNDLTFKADQIPSEINPLKTLLRKDGLET